MRRQHPPPRRHLDRRLLRLLRRRQRHDSQGGRSAPAHNLRPRRRARLQRHRPGTEAARRRRAVPGAARGRERQDAGRRGRAHRGVVLRQEEHGARAGAVREGPQCGGVRPVHRVLSARVGGVLLGTRPLARRRGGRRRRVQLLPPLRGVDRAGAAATADRNVCEGQSCLYRLVRRNRGRCAAIGSEDVLSLDVLTQQDQAPGCEWSW